MGDRNQYAIVQAHDDLFALLRLVVFFLHGITAKGAANGTGYHGYVTASAAADQATQCCATQAAEDCSHA